MMQNNSLGITGEIDSGPFAKKIIYLAGGATLALQFGWFFHGSLLGIGIAIPLALVLLFSKAKLAAVALFVWTLLNSTWILLTTIPMLQDGRYLRAYLLIFCGVVLWLQYRAIRATTFIKAEADLSSVEDVFE